MTWLTIFLAFYVVWIIATLQAFYKNYSLARKTGLPLLLLPLSHYNPIWMILSVPLIRPLAEKILPEWIYEIVDVATYGWEFRRGWSIFEKYGPAFILVSASANELSVTDPELATEILKRIKDFPQTYMASVIMNIFGPNLLTSEGETWARQRKLIAPNVNEKISKLVFGESVQQAQQMLSSYMDDLRGVTDDTMKGMKRVAINVLAVAGFGVSVPWKEQPSERPKGYRLTYMDATKTVVENIIEAAVFPAKMLTLPFFAPAWQDIGHAKNEFPKHTRSMLENERKLQEDTSEPRNNLMSLLVRLSDVSKVEADPNVKRAEGEKTQVILDEEIVGNLFIFTSAGFDTTANTMSYALAVLTAYPEWQDWLYEEIRQVVGDKELGTLEYNEVYPHLPRCMALMVSCITARRLSFMVTDI
jgi:cytochrome P450